MALISVDKCFFKCGRDSMWWFRCRSCVPMVRFVVCNECRGSSVCLQCGSTDAFFEADSDMLSSSDPSSTEVMGHSREPDQIELAGRLLRIGADNRADIVDQLRNLATTLENLENVASTPKQALYRKMALGHAKDDLKRQVRRRVGRELKTSDIAYNTSPTANGHFQTDITVFALLDDEGQYFVCSGEVCEDRKAAERSAAFAMLEKILRMIPTSPSTQSTVSSTG